jgi:hypothetical protein
MPVDIVAMIAFQATSKAHAVWLAVVYNHEEIDHDAGLAIASYALQTGCCTKIPRGMHWGMRTQQSSRRFRNTTH